MRLSPFALLIFLAPTLPGSAVAQARSGTVTVAGVPFRYVREGHGPSVVAIGSAVYYPKAYSPELRRHFDLIFVDSRHFVPTYQPTADELASVTLETFADDLEGVRRQLGIPSWTVIGHSVHAQIALAYARKYPEHTSHVVLIGGVPFSDRGATADSFFNADASADRKAALAESTVHLDSLLKVTPPTRQFAVGYYHRAALYWANPRHDASDLLEGLENGPALARLFAVVPSRDEVRASLEAIRAPILLVLGRLDYAVPYFTWQPLIDGLPNVTYVLLEHDSHNPQTESPGHFDPVLVNWMRTH